MPFQSEDEWNNQPVGRWWPADPNDGQRLNQAVSVALVRLHIMTHGNSTTLIAFYVWSSATSNSGFNRG